VEINQLRYFLAVVENGSFSKAAERCYVSQSTASELIQKLEAEVGKRLLYRGRRKIAPTEAGKMLVGPAKRILVQIEIAKREIRKSDGPHFGKVKFGILPTIAPYFLPHILETFQKRCPKIQFAIHEGMTVQLLDLIEENKLDLAVVSLPVKEHGFDVEKLFDEELLLALPSQNPLARKEKIRLQDLHCENFILLHEGHCLGDQVLDFCSRHDFSPRIALRSGQLATVLSLVKAGVGISLVPKMATDEVLANVAYRSLDKPRPKRIMAIIKREKRPLKTAAQEFLKHLRHAGKAFARNAEKESAGSSPPLVQI
jgi:DNA-binding transcriptional LysR family regulator